MEHNSNSRAHPIQESHCFRALITSLKINLPLNLRSQWLTTHLCACSASWAVSNSFLINPNHHHHHHHLSAYSAATCCAVCTGSSFDVSFLRASSHGEGASVPSAKATSNQTVSFHSGSVHFATDPSHPRLGRALSASFCCCCCCCQEALRVTLLLLCAKKSG